MMRKTCSSFLIFLKPTESFAPPREGVDPFSRGLKLYIRDAKYNDESALLIRSNGGLRLNYLKQHYPEDLYEVYPLPGKFSKLVSYQFIMKF